MDPNTRRGGWSPGGSALGERQCTAGWEITSREAPRGCRQAAKALHRCRRGQKRQGRTAPAAVEWDAGQVGVGKPAWWVGQKKQVRRRYRSKSGEQRHRKKEQSHWTASTSRVYRPTHLTYTDRTGGCSWPVPAHVITIPVIPNGLSPTYPEICKSSNGWLDKTSYTGSGLEGWELNFSLKKKKKRSGPFFKVFIEFVTILPPCPIPPSIRRQSLNYWTTREIP